MSTLSFPNRPKSTPRAPLPEVAGQIRTQEGMVILQPVTMRIPNRHSVYSPSRLRPRKKVSYDEFLVRYANHPHGIRICFDETPSPATIFERSELVTAYGYGLDCWYIVVS
jgi:hypothetical protein